MICGFKECPICLEEQPAPSCASRFPPPLPPCPAPLPLPPAGILEALTLSKEC